MNDFSRSKVWWLKLAWTWIHYKAHKIIWRFPKNSSIAPYPEYVPDGVYLDKVDNKVV